MESMAGRLPAARCRLSADASLLSPQVVKLKAFSKFENTTEALASATAIVDSKLSKGGCRPGGGGVGCRAPRRHRSPAPLAAGLKKFLKKNAEGDTLAVVDSKIGKIVQEKLGIPCVHG